MTVCADTAYARGEVSPLSALLSYPARKALRYGGPAFGTKEAYQLHHLTVFLLNAMGHRRNPDRYRTRREKTKKASTTIPVRFQPVHS